MHDMNDSLKSDHSFAFAITRRFFGNTADAEDATQEALLRAYERRGTFRGDSSYRSWLYRIAVTTAIGALRKQKRSRIDLFNADTEHLAEGVADPAKGPDAQMADAEFQESVSRALLALRPAYRDVFLARVDATEPEVAERLGISVANVKIRMHRARMRLRTELTANASAGAAAI